MLENHEDDGERSQRKRRKLSTENNSQDISSIRVGYLVSHSGTRPSAFDSVCFELSIIYNNLSRVLNIS
jgi:hypothetical protein